MNRKVRDFRGNEIHIECDEADLRSVLTKTLIDPFREDLEYSWACGTREEEHVKNYLSYVGSLLIREPDKHGVLSDRKIGHIMGSETPVENMSNIPEGVTKYKKPRKSNTHVVTAFDRAEAIRRKHPNASHTTVSVDTDNRFKYKDHTYEIAKDVAQYQPVETAEGLRYDFDQVVVADCGRDVWFFDQGFEAIPKEKVTRVG